MSQESADKPRLSLAIPGKKKGSTASKKKAPSRSADVQAAFGSPDDNNKDNGDNHHHHHHHHDDNKPKEPLVIPAVPNKFGLSSSTNKTELSAADEEALQALQAQAQHNNGETAGGGKPSKDMIIQASKDTFQRETQQFKADLEALPDALDSEDYSASVPIAEFGAAMLRGMGWKDPEPSRKKDKKSDNDDEVMPRPHRLGLGAVPKMDDLPPPGRLRRPDQVKQRERLQEQQKEYAVERERQLAMDKQRTMQNGSLVYLRNGSRAKIIQLVGVPGLNMVKVWKENDQEASIVKRREIEGLLSRDELEDRPYRHPVGEKPKAVEDDSEVKGEQSDDRKREKKEKRRREDESRQSRDRSSKRTRDESSSSSSRRMTWAIPNIRVRVVTEKLGRRYFKEKGIVVDVTSKGATLRLDKSGTVLDRVPEHYLETALPKAGGKAIVLAGRNKFAKGKLLERDSKSGKGSIQIFEDMSVLTLSLDDLAEYVGSLDDDIEE